MDELQQPAAASPYAGLTRKIRPGGSEAAAMAAAAAPRLRLIRLADRGSSGDVYIDDILVAQIDAGGATTVELASGQHRLKVCINGKFAVAEFGVENGETIRFETIYEPPLAGFRRGMLLVGLLIRPTGRVFLNRID